jgi:hypothetical protein
MTSVATTFANGISVFTPPDRIGEELGDASREPILPTDVVALFVQLAKGVGTLAATSATRIRDPWITFEHTRTTTNGQTIPRHLLISSLGWSAQEAAEIRLRLLPFEEDWNAPGMDLYDAL